MAPYHLPKCLVVDDDKAWLRLLAVIIDNPQVEYVNTAQDALLRLAANGYAMVITDTNMPGMTGVDLLDKIRADPKLADIPIIMLFAGLKGSSLDRDDILARGATLVLTKEEFLAQHPYLLRRWLGP